MAESSFHTTTLFMAGTPMDLATITTAVTGAKAAVDLIKTSIAARDQAKAEEAVTEAKRTLAVAYDALLGVSQEALNLVQQVAAAQKRIEALEAENKQLQAQTEERDRYVLAEIGGGVMAYALKPDDDRGEPPHYLCQPCMSKNLKIVLQPHGPRGNLRCPACEQVFLINATRPTYTARLSGY